jgi:hypothetical protein
MTFIAPKVSIMSLKTQHNINHCRNSKHDTHPVCRNSAHNAKCYFAECCGAILGTKSKKWLNNKKLISAKNVLERKLMVDGALVPRCTVCLISRPFSKGIQNVLGMGDGLGPLTSLLGWFEGLWEMARIGLVGLGWVGLGWVGLGCVGLGWVRYG